MFQTSLKTKVSLGQEKLHGLLIFNFGMLLVQIDKNKKLRKRNLTVNCVLINDGFC